MFISREYDGYSMNSFKGTRQKNFVTFGQKVLTKK